MLDKVYEQFTDSNFERAYQDVLKELNEEGFFKCDWWHAHAKSGDYFKKELEEKLDLILSGKSKSESKIIIGENWEQYREIWSIGVYEYIPWRVAQKIKVQKKSLFPPRLQKIIPFIGVDIWVDDSINHTRVIDCAINKYGNHIRVPTFMDGFPVIYNQTRAFQR